MKHLLIAILEDNEYSASLLRKLSAEGYNATVLSSTSLHHVLHDEAADTPLFITMNMLTSKHQFEENTTIMCVLDEKELVKVQEIIRKETDHFTLTNGGMFSLPIENFEGSF